MGELVLVTYDWVPDLPRGFVRDLRVRWALEEAGLPYRVESTPFRDRGAEHLARQPFSQVPWLRDGDLTVFESGAILLHLGERSEKLMPRDPRGRSEAVQWVLAALNSVEMPALPWSLYRYMGDEAETPGRRLLEDWLAGRLGHMERVLGEREWLVGEAPGAFSVADIAMAEVLRLVDRFDRLAEHPSCRAYVARATARPAFAKAHADQIAHFAAGDARR